MDTQAQPQLDWHTETNPDMLLNAALVVEREASDPNSFLDRRIVYDRRLRLFSCACARMVWDVLPTDARSAVQISERVAYGRVTSDALIAAGVRVILGPVTANQHALSAAVWASHAVLGPRFNAADGEVWNPNEAARSAAKALATRAAGPAPPGRPTTAAWEAAWNTAFAAARAYQAELVRDIFPPPGHTPRLEREWLTSTVLTLARQADETGEYSALPILADALQDAGCDDDFMLDRCRAASNIHCRGNWVVDLVLGRE